jgi:cysteinyl-tRNA synthetase
VNDLLSQRLQFRKRKMFDEADDIRDELLNVHGVTM